MSNMIDLTKDGLRKSIREHEERYHEPTIEDVETILSCLEGIGLLAELKRCREKIDEAHWMLMQAYHGQKEREREIDYLRSYCLDNGVCPYCGEAQQDPALREHLGVLKMCYSCEDKIHFGIEPKDNASE